jgi:hypothetical protein
MRPMISKGPRAGRAAEFAAVGGLLALFAALTLVKFESPASTWEGTRIVEKAWELVLAWESGDHTELLKGYPLYHGEVMAYFLLPFFLKWGAPWGLVQSWVLAMNLFTLLFAYLAVRNVFSRRAALLTLALMAVHPSFIMGTKRFMDAIGAVGFFSVGCLLMLERWWTLRRDAWFGAAMLLLGLGMGTHFWFCWFVTALAVCALLFRRDVAARAGLGRPGRGLRLALWGAAGLAPGLAPILVREIGSGFASWEGFLIRARQHTPGELLANLGHLDSAMDSSFYLATFFGQGSEGGGNEMYGPFVAAALAYLFWRALFGGAAYRKPFFAAATLFLLMLAQAAPATSLPLKLFLLYPFPQLFVALAACDIACRPMPRARRWALLAPFALLAAAELRVLAAYFRLLERVGGARASTDAVYDVADWLNCRMGARDMLAADYFVAGNLRQLMPREKLANLMRFSTLIMAMPPKEWTSGVEAAVAASGRYPRAYLVWHGSQDGSFSQAPKSKDEQERLPRLLRDWPPSTFVKLRDFRDRGGEVVMSVYRIAPAASREVSAPRR